MDNNELLVPGLIATMVVAGIIWSAVLGGVFHWLIIAAAIIVTLQVNMEVNRGLGKGRRARRRR